MGGSSIGVLFGAQALGAALGPLLRRHDRRPLRAARRPSTSSPFTIVIANVLVIWVPKTSRPRNEAPGSQLRARRLRRRRRRGTRSTVIRPEASIIAEEWAYYVHRRREARQPTCARASASRSRCRPETRIARHPLPARLAAATRRAGSSTTSRPTPRAYFVLIARLARLRGTSSALDAAAAALVARAPDACTREPPREYDARQGRQPPLRGSRGCAGRRCGCAGARPEVAAATAAWVEAFNSRDPARIAAPVRPRGGADRRDRGEAAHRRGGDRRLLQERVRSAPTQRVALGERIDPHLRRHGDRQRHLHLLRNARRQGNDSRRRATPRPTASAAGSG